MTPSAESLPTPARAAILSSQDLRKFYGTRLALRNLSFSLAAGRVLGLLGPNGAGKTTAMRILTTVLEPTSGRFVVDGTSSDEPNEIRRKIGVLPEGLGFPKQVTAIGYLTYFGQLYGRSAPDAAAKGSALLSDVGLQQRADSAIGTFSHGMRQRLGIARALVNDPAVVFLDEPTLGLDPRGQRELLALVRTIARDRGAGVVLCSHLLSDIEETCDDVVIMNEGQVVARGTVDEVIGRARPTRQDAVRLRVPPRSVPAALRVLAALPQVAEATAADETTGWLAVQLVTADQDATEAEHRPGNALLQALIGADVAVLGFEAGGGSLQDVFLQLTAETIR